MSRFSDKPSFPLKGPQIRPNTQIQDWFLFNTSAKPTPNKSNPESKSNTKLDYFLLLVSCNGPANLRHCLPYSLSIQMKIGTMIFAEFYSHHSCWCSYPEAVFSCRRRCSSTVGRWGLPFRPVAIVAASESHSRSQTQLPLNVWRNKKHPHLPKL